MWPRRALPLNVWLVLPIIAVFLGTGSSLKAELHVHHTAGSATPLSDFRDAVVKRPTPPEWPEMANASRIQEIDDFDKYTEDPKMLASTCTALQRKLVDKPSLQEPIFIQEGHKLAIKAMKDFSTDRGMQISCGNLLGWMAQWNWVLARAVAEAGALDAMVAAMKNFPDDQEIQAFLAGEIGAFTDFDQENKERLVELGLVDHVYKVNDRAGTEFSVAMMYNLWSTICALPEVAQLMVETYGELERGVRHMKTFKRNTIRGEVIMIDVGCFMKTDAQVERLLKAGIVPEIVSALRDELSGEFGELDAIGKDRMASNVMYMLRVFASKPCYGKACKGQQTHDALREAGAVDQVLAVLQYWRSIPHKEHGFAELQHDLEKEACQTLLEIDAGEASNLLEKEACRTLLEIDAS